MSTKKTVTPSVPLTISAFLLLFTAFGSQAQPGDHSLAALERNIDSIISTRMDSEHIPGVALIVIKDGKVLLKKGYGYARIGSERQKVNPDSTIFRIGSISKTFTATALLQLADQKKIDLHGDVNTYLKSIQVPTAFGSPVTPSHLLNHSAGFDEIGQGRRVFAKDQLIPMASFLKNRLVRVRPAGIVPAYSTYGIALAGLIVEEVSNQSLESYFRKNIWEPLGMTMTNIEVPDQLQPYVALGYEYQNGVNQAQPWEWYHTFPASSINSTVTDMGKYMQMHLNFGTFNGKTILSKRLASAMQKQQITVHPEVGGFGYGFYEREWHGIRTFDHGGEMSGFSSYLVLAPQQAMGIFIVHHHEHTNLRREVVSTIIGHFYPNSNKAIPQRTSALKPDAAMVAGTYRWLSNCITCPDGGNRQTWQLKANEDGTLSGFGRKFVQVAPLLYKSEDGERTMGFRQNEKGKVQYMSLGNVNVFEKLEAK